MAMRGHLWTIGSRLRSRVASVAGPVETRPWHLDVEDTDRGTVRLTGRLAAPDGAREAVALVHGLGGSVDSPYVGAAAAAFASAGVAVLAMNLRGSDRRGEDFYHAGLSADVHSLLACPELAGYERLYLAGFSLGGHVALRAACEAPDPRLAAVAAVCSPLDLEPCVAVIDSRARFLYRRYLLASLLDIYSAVAARGEVALPVEEAARVRTLREWDERVVAPRWGFAGAGDYYRRASVGPLLGRLAVPALLVAAESDPMLPADLVRASLEARGRPDALTVAWVPGGGHMAFPRRLDLGLPSGGEPGLEAQLVAWLRAVGR